ncbi:MAG: helix-turn-helix domain-containing protein, partial [Pseudonocardia sp.]|nr:helix-turn-helix domain-containing protein [Pseudonocardia sp.]
AAHRALADLLAPLHIAGGALLDTLTAYLDGGGALESCARTLFVHPNTVRYRLRRVSELTGRAPTEPRDAHVLRTALVTTRLGGYELRNPYNDRRE